MARKQPAIDAPEALIQWQADGHGLLEIRVAPGAAQDRLSLEDVDGAHRLKVAVTAPPEDGRANKAVLKLLAKALKRPKSALSIVRGETSRTKLIRVEAP